MRKKLFIAIGVLLFIVINIEVYFILNPNYHRPLIPATTTGITEFPSGYFISDIASLKIIATLEKIYLENGNLYADISFVRAGTKVIQQILILPSIKDKNDSFIFTIAAQDTYEFTPQYVDVKPYAYHTNSEIISTLKSFTGENVVIIFPLPHPVPTKYQAFTDTIFQTYQKCNQQFYEYLKPVIEKTYSCIPYARTINVYVKSL